MPVGARPHRSPGGIAATAAAAAVALACSLALTSSAHAGELTPGGGLAPSSSPTPSATGGATADPSPSATWSDTIPTAPSPAPSAAAPPSPGLTTPTSVSTSTASPSASGSTSASPTQTSPPTTPAASPGPAVTPSLADEPAPVSKPFVLTPAQIAAAKALADAQRQLTALSAQASQALQRSAAAQQSAEVAEGQAAAARSAYEAARRRTEIARASMGAYAAAAYRDGPTDGTSLVGLASIFAADDLAQMLQRTIDIDTVGRGRVLAIDELRRAQYDEELALRGTSASQANALKLLADAAVAKTLADAEVAKAKALVDARLGIAGALAMTPDQLRAMGPVPAGACQGLPVLAYPNGQIPTAALCPLWGGAGQLLRADAAAAFSRMSRAYAVTFGRPICVTDSYRDLLTQQVLFVKKPTLAAVPGTSNHGWARAVDLCDGIEDFGTLTHDWMLTNAPAFGWFHPGWAEPQGSRPEPWHWEFGY